MRFVKMHGLGNDYIVVGTPPEQVNDPVALARSMADRHRGIGSDGLILVTPSDVADVGMRIYNADGSPAEMCGNGIRCVAKYAVERGLCPSPQLSIETPAGIREANCLSVDGNVTQVRIDMGAAQFFGGDEAAEPADIGATRDRPIQINGRTFRVTCVSVGNPHAVVFVDDLGQIELAREGRALATHSMFPAGVNAHFVRVDSAHECTMRTWERGSGATQACGTGACAVAAAARHLGRAEFPLTVHLPGGDLFIENTDPDKPVDQGRLLMTGPAVEVFSGVWLAATSPVN